MLWDDFEFALHQEKIIRAVFKLKRCPSWADPKHYSPGEEFICTEYHGDPKDKSGITMRSLKTGSQIAAGAGYFEFVGMRAFKE